MIDYSSYRSEVARRANRTRQVRAATEDLRATYGDAKYDVLDRLIVPYFAKSEARLVGDLLGGGRSCAALARAGMRVLAVENLSLYTKRGEGGKGYGREFAREVAQHIATASGADRLVIGEAAGVLSEVEAFYFDGMGPLGPATPTGRFLSELRQHSNVRHVAVTHLASRIEGMGDVSGGASDAYLLLARGVLKSLGFTGIFQVAYRSGRIPMAVAVACSHKHSKDCPARSRARFTVFPKRRRHGVVQRTRWPADPELRRQYKRAYDAANLEHANALRRARVAARRREVPLAENAA